MSNVNMMFTVAAAEIGALVAIYVILGVLIALAVFALIRLAGLAQKTRSSAPKAEDRAMHSTKEDLAPETEGVDPELLREKEREIEELEQAAEDSAAELKAKDDEIAALQDRVRQLEAAPAPVVVAAAEAPVEQEDCASCATVAELREQVAYLEGRVHELEARPATVVYVQQSETPSAEAPAPMEDKTLKESLAAASRAGHTNISKKSIAAYIIDTFGAETEVNERGSKTSNGKLPLSDTHFLFLSDDNKVCFTYVYETLEGGVLSLVRLDAERAEVLAASHACVSHSLFPKNKAGDWYSVIADETFTEEEYYAIFGESIAYLKGLDAILPEAATDEPIQVEERTLKESLAAASLVGENDITKKTIAAYISKKYGKDAEVNERGAKTGNGKLPLSDNHFIFLADGSKVCFTYVYDTPEGGEVALVRLDEERAAALAEKHPCVVRSAFPKNKARDWYSVIADNSFTADEFYAVFDESIAYLRGAEYVAVAIAEEPAPAPERTLKESLAAASLAGENDITKKTIAAYIVNKYGTAAEVNERAAKTGNGKLPLSDNHFIFLADGSKVCFTYVYDTPEGGEVALVRLDEERAAALAEKHPCVVRSAFPKNKARDWYSVIADNSFTADEFYAVFDESIAYLRGTDYVASAEGPAPAPERSLKESLAAASLAGENDLSKKTIAAYIVKKYGVEAEVNERAAKTGNGKLPLSDNHFIFLADGSKVCFTYVYDTPEGGEVALVRLDAERAAALAEKHPCVVRSAFPKNKAKDWYSVIADSSFTADEFYAVFDESIAYLRGTDYVAPTEEPAPAASERTLKESLAAASLAGENDLSKKTIAAYIVKKYGVEAEVNERAAKTGNGKLPLSDNHFIFLADGSKVCFTYVYDTPEGGEVALVRLDAERAATLAKKHPCVMRSAFPKNKAKDWYSVIADSSFTADEFYAVFDESIAYLRGTDYVAPVAPVTPAEEPAPEAEVAADVAVPAVGTITKKSVVAYLDGKYLDKLELHPRKKTMDSGKLPVPDNHFVLRGEERICFSYVYEDEKRGQTTVLVRLSETEGEALIKAHGAAASHSSFPRNKAKDWYKIVIDDTFTEKEIYDLLDLSIQYVLSI